MEDLRSERIILHIDFDMFFAAVELLDNPDLRNKPIAVAPPHAKRGIVTTASYEARRFGIGSGMAIDTAKKRCPELQLIPPRMWKYERINRVFRRIVSRYTDRYEFVALDEAYLDITGTHILHRCPRQTAIDIQREIYVKTGCTCSVGLGYNKISAKLASEQNKPNGFGKLETREAFLDYTRDLRLSKMNGIGDSMAGRLFGLFHRRTLGGLREIALEEMEFYVGRNGKKLYRMIRGEDDRVVGEYYKRDGYASRRTFQEDIVGRDEVLKRMLQRVEAASWELKRDRKHAHTVSVIIRYSRDFKRVTRNKTLKNPVREPLEIYRIVEEVTREMELDRPIRQVGVRLSNTRRGSVQIQLQLGEGERFKRRERIFKLTDRLKTRFGKEVISDALNPGVKV